jgi:tetratricopeptide (TPR) repeat protein
VFQYVAVLLLDAEHYDMALDSAQLAVTYAEDAIQRQAVDAGIFIAALIRRALVHLHMSLHTKSSTMQTYFREQAENDLTTALQQAESGYPLLKAEAEAGLGDVLARLSGDVTRAFALFEQALAYAPTEVTVDRHGFLTSRAMIVCRRAQAMLYLHAQQATRDQVHGSLAAGERDIQEALHMVPPLQRRGYLDLLVTQFECALARKRPDEAMRIAHELAFWLAKKPAGLQRITARYHHGMQRLHTSHPDLFELAA